ncbi:MAG: alpha-hydroxy-acid oxidizing protein [Butyrivibrio sp.]|nr:alpha-hydroxy-acid oxidizing protein [Butyrivibrio sp.]
MRLGTSSPLKHDSPEEWALNQVKLGCSAVVFPVQSNEPESRIKSCHIKDVHLDDRFPYAIPPMMILPEIRETLEEKNVEIIVDCGISSGADVYKAIALGADAAAVGRSMLPALENEGVKGVSEFIKEVGNELRFIMSATGFEHVSDIDESALWYK